MKITIPRAELKDAVAGLARVATTRSSLPILNGVRFDAAKGIVTALATDLDQSARYQFASAQAEGDGACIIPLANLKALAKGSGNERVELEPGANDTITVINHVGENALRHSVAGYPVSNWPSMGDEIQTNPAEGFLSTYRRISPFASTDSTRRVLTGVYVDVEGKGEHNVTLVACDGKRLTCCNSMKLPINPKAGMIVPVTRFLTWPALVDEASIGLNSGKNMQTFGLQSGPWTYRVKVTDGVYPNWRQVLPSKDGMPHQFAFTDADVDAMKKILPALPGEDAMAVIGAKDGTVTLSGQNKDDRKAATVKLTAGSRYTGEGGQMSIPRNQLMEAFMAGFRNFGFSDVYSAIRSDDNKGATHVLMPLRASPPVPAEAPASETVQPTPTAETQPKPPKETPNMANENTTEPTALEKLQTAYELAKSKVREANQALADVADAIKLAIREDRQRRSEVENVRAGLQKLQAIKV